MPFNPSQNTAEHNTQGVPKLIPSKFAGSQDCPVARAALPFKIMDHRNFKLLAHSPQKKKAVSIEPHRCFVSHKATKWEMLRVEGNRWSSMFFTDRDLICVLARAMFISTWSGSSDFQSMTISVVLFSSTFPSPLPGVPSENKFPAVGSEIAIPAWKTSCAQWGSPASWGTRTMGRGSWKNTNKQKSSELFANKANRRSKMNRGKSGEWGDVSRLAGFTIRYADVVVLKRRG